MDSWNDDRQCAGKSNDFIVKPISNTVEWYREAVANLEQAIENINCSASDHSFAQFYLNKVSSLIITLHSDVNNPDRQEELQEVLKTVDLVSKKLKIAPNPSEKCDSKNVLEQACCSLLVKKDFVSFDEVVGLEEAKKSLNEAIIMPVLYPQLFSGKRKPWTRILLYGPPGTGKSRLAHAVANKIDSSFYSVSSSDVLSSFFGQSEKMIKELFTQARSARGRSVIFIDEIDSLCRRRTEKEEETVRRIKKRVYIPLPGMEPRIEILKLHSGDDCNLDDDDWKQLGELTKGYSGSDLAVLVNAALFQPVRELQHTTRWRLNHTGKYTPCPDDTPATLTCHFQRLPPSSVLTRTVNVSDFKACLKVNKATVSPEDILQFVEFTNRFGVVGS